MDTLALVLLGWAAVTGVGAVVRVVSAGRASRCERLRSVEADHRPAPPR
ncbi:MAG: hypothetical protein JWN08_2913 [Frankiales bacterium]|jgi:hypothetical protein|nr:hypothetical protein [Frankiales bacterium]